MLGRGTTLRRRTTALRTLGGTRRASTLGRLRSRSTTAVSRVTRATTLPALRLTGASARFGAPALSLLAIRASHRTCNAMMPATTRGLGRIGIGLHVARHRDLELLGSKLDASRTALAVATPRGLLLALVGRGPGRDGGSALLGG